MSKNKKKESRYKSRKLIATLVLFITTTAMLFFGVGDYETYISFMKYLFSAYVVGNVGEHFSDALKNKVN